MSIISFIRNLGKKSAADNLYPGTWTPIGGSAYDTTERNLLASNKEWVYVSVDKVANAVASVRFKVMQYARNGDDQELFDGAMVDFLEKPADDFTGKDFVYLNTVYKELTGNAFWEKQKGKMNLYPLVPTQVSPIITGGKLAGYRYNNSAGERVLQLKDVLHDRYIDPARPHWGVGKLSKIARWADTSSYTNEFLRLFFVNGASFGGFITTEEESQDRIALIKAGLANDHVGVANAHKIAVLPKGSDYKQTTAKMSDMEMGETDDRYRDKILAAFGVPKSVLGIVEDVNRSNAEASEYTFAKYTIKPIVDDLVEFLNVQIAPLLDPSGKSYFAADDFIPKNMDHELKEREISLGRQPYKTVNEVRAEIGLPPVKGGEVVYGNPMQTPLGTPAASPHLPGDDDDEEDEKPPKKAFTGRTRALPRHVRQADKVDRAFDAITEKLAEFIDSTEPAQQRELADAAAFKEFSGRADEYKVQLEGKVKDFNNRQQREVVNHLGQITKDVARGDLFDYEQEVTAMIDIVKPLLLGLAIDQGIAEYQAQGFAGTFDSGSQQLRKMIDIAARRLAKGYNRTTGEQLKKALNDGLRDGLDITALTAEVNRVYDYANIVRARMVAETESFYIANKASREAYIQSGVVKTMRWWTAEDERVCEFCGPMHGRVIGVKEVFFKKGEVVAGRDGGNLNLNYRTMDVPPLHTSCRCFVRPEEISVD